MSDVRVDPPEVRGAVRNFILTEFLPEEDPSSLKDDTPLVSGGVLDSISTARLVSFLEGLYGIRFKPHEVGGVRMDTVNRIVEAVEGKVR